jgi:hypothetical protein
MADHLSYASVGGTPELEVVARMVDRPGNPALTPDGRLIVSLHPFPYGEPSPYHVVEVLEDGSTRPFPNEEWSTAPDEEEGVGLSAVIGVQSDRNGVVWIMDMGGGELPPNWWPGTLSATSFTASSRSPRTPGGLAPCSRTSP